MPPPHPLPPAHPCVLPQVCQWNMHQAVLVRLHKAKVPEDDKATIMRLVYALEYAATEDAYLFLERKLLEALAPFDLVAYWNGTTNRSTAGWSNTSRWRRMWPRFAVRSCARYRGCCQG